MDLRKKALAVDDEHRTRVTVEPRKTGDGLVIVSHNWCDPTTWYTQSELEEDETLSDSGDGMVFNSDHDNWIDLSHGKVYREDLFVATYALPVVKVDDVEKTVRAPWADSGGDYTIDYASGNVTFFSSQSGNTVTATYRRENGSLFVVSPTTDKQLWIEYSEVQFSKNVGINAAIHFQPWCYNPADLPNKMAAAAATTYKTMDNFIEEANGCYPVIPAMGGERGFAQDRITFPFNYSVLKELHACYGLEIRIWVEGDLPFTGEYATSTFYCTSFSEI